MEFATLCTELHTIGHLACEATTSLQSAERAGAEVLSFAAVIGGDAAAVHIVKLCCQSLSKPAALDGKAPQPHLNGWALALGATHRTVGGIVLQKALPDVVTTLISLAKGAGTPLAPRGSAVHALHGLFLVMCSAFGPSGWVEVVLETAVDCLLRPGAREAGIEAAAAAIVTAIVEVQGPDFCPTSKTRPVAECEPVWSRCAARGVQHTTCSIHSCLAAKDQSGHCACRTIMAAISGQDLTLATASVAEAIAAMQQRVLCARSVISFAADVPKRDYLPVLLATLASPVQQLRHVAAASLHVLSSSHAGAAPHHFTLARLQCVLPRFPVLEFLHEHHVWHGREHSRNELNCSCLAGGMQSCWCRSSVRWLCSRRLTASAAPRCARY